MIYSNTLQPATGQDMSISQLTPTVNDGSNTRLYASLVGAGDIKRALLKFDLSGVIGAASLTASNITSASIDLISDQGGTISAGKAYRIKPVNNRWDEFTGTWNTQNGSKAWGGSVGAGTSGVDYSSTALGSYVATSASAGQTRSITITSYDELILMINDNHGLILIADDEGTIDGTSVCASSENIEARRPSITMTYYPPSTIANDTGAGGYDGYHVGDVEQQGSSGANYNGGYTNISDFVAADVFGATGDITVYAEAAADAADPTTAADSIFNFNEGGAPNNTFLSFRQYTTTNSIRFRLKTRLGTVVSKVAMLTDVTDYNTMATTLIGTTYAFYANGGVEQTGVVSSAWDVTSSGATMAIGANNTTPDIPFYGYIRNVIIGNEVGATAAQIATIDTKVKAGTLVGSDLDTIFGAGKWEWWALDEYATAPTSRLRATRDARSYQPPQTELPQPAEEITGN
jgi:hypothetical protein